MILTVFLSQFAARVISNSYYLLNKTTSANSNYTPVSWVSLGSESTSENSQQSQDYLCFSGCQRQYHEPGMFPRRQRAPHRAAQLSRLGRTESLERCEQCWVSRRTAVIRGGGWRSGARLKPTYGAVVGPQSAQLLSGLLHALTLTLPVLNTLVRV